MTRRENGEFFVWMKNPPQTHPNLILPNSIYLPPSLKQKQANHHFRFACSSINNDYTCGKFLRMTFNMPKALVAPCTTQVRGLSTR
jgi:hypothetical protein